MSGPDLPLPILAAGGLRLDKWLWFARFVKTRSAAQALCEAGRVRVNRVVVSKPAAAVRPGDVLTFPQGRDIRVVRIVALGVRRGPPAEARVLYQDLIAAPDTPPPPPAPPG